MIRPPSGRMGPITVAERAAIMAKSPVKGKYDTTIDARVRPTRSCRKRVAKEAADAAQAEQGGGGIGDWIGSIFGTNRKRGERLTTGQTGRARTVTATVVGSIAAAIGKKIGGSTGASIGRSIGAEHDGRDFAAITSRHPEVRCEARLEGYRSRRPSRRLLRKSHLRVHGSLDRSKTMTSAAEALPKVLERIDADLDNRWSGCSSF